MSYKIAIASTDGIVVNQHFGKADSFHIFKIDSEKYDYVEQRPVESCCGGSGHDAGAFRKALDALHDVSAVIVSKIGGGASDFLEAHGLAVYEAPYPIEPLLIKILNERLYEVDKWQFPTKN